MRSSPAKSVRRRRVFYIPGYDPFPPRRYRELYRKEGAMQALISGYSLVLSRRKHTGPDGWHVASEIDGKAVSTEMQVLVWADLVQGSMGQGIPGTYLQLFRTAWAYIGSGALFRLMRLRKGPIIAALYPIVLLLMQLALAGLMGWGVALIATGYLPALAAAPLGLATVALVLVAFRRLDRHFFAYYLMHDYAYTAQHGGANPAELEARMAAFRQTIRAALESNADEVLVVGHSSGAHLGISILADLIREGLPARKAELAFLTLGQVVPMVSFLPHADRLRADLNFLSARPELTWVDVTAPGDGCAFALCDPVSVSGVAPPDQRWPLVISAAFTQTLSPERWKELRWRFFRLHFQYLCAFDRPADYDYFRITAGPLSLRARFEGRAPSKSRIVEPASGHTSMHA